MRYPGEDIIKELDALILDALDSFSSSLNEANSGLIDALSDFVSRLERNKAGTIKASIANIRAITSYKNKLTALLASGQYAEGVTVFMQSFQQSSSLVNTYFGEVSSTFEAKAFYKEVQRQVAATTLETMLGSGIGTNYTQPIIKVLQQSVIGQSSTKQALQIVRETLSENGQSTSWAKRIADDSLNQYSRNYTQLISDDLGLTHYLYSGTIIDTTRQFCQSKVGKVFTEAEVRAWASQSWSGKIPGTNAGNIQIYLGGRRCRHRLVPISEGTYRLLKG